MKLNAAAQAAWNQQPSTTPSQQPQAQSYQNGTQQQSLHAPPGVPPPASFSQPSQGQGQAQAQGTPFVGNGNGNGAVATTTGNGGGNAVGTDAQGQSTAPTPAAPVPQTPAQQVLMSAADRWGLLGLLAMIKNADPDQALLSVGTDLGTMGLDMQQQGCVASRFFSHSLPDWPLLGTCIRRSLHHGRIRAPRIQSNQISIYLVVTMSNRQLLVLERQPRSVTRRCSSCSIRRHGTRYRRSPRRSCKRRLCSPSRAGVLKTMGTDTTGTGGTTRNCGSG